MRVLISGGAGFIGGHLAHALCANGDAVAVLDDLSSGRRENVPRAARFFQVDLRDREATFQAVREFAPDAVSHQAAQASVAVSVREPALDAAINVLGSLNLLDACTAAGSKVARFVFASTGGAIYGDVPEGISASEDYAPNPVSPYAIHKLAVERLLGVYAAHRGLSSTVLRYANVYGPGQDPHGEAGVVAIFFDAVRAGRALRVNARSAPGDAGCVRDYVFVSDVVRMNLAAIGGRIHERVINVGTGRATTTRELALAVMAAAGRDVALQPAESRPGDVERSLLDPSKALAYLGELVSLEAGLRQIREHDGDASAR